MKRHVRNGHSGNGLSTRTNHRTEVNKHEISAQRRRLLDLMQRLNFGWIYGLVVEDSEPVFDPPPRVVCDIKFGGENVQRPEIVSDNFILKSQVLEFFAYLDRLGIGTVETIEVKHGLPFRMSVEELV